MRSVGGTTHRGFRHIGLHRDEPAGRRAQAINLGQGFPDFAGPDFVKDAADAAIDADLNQYAPSHGTPRLRRAIAADWARALRARDRPRPRGLPSPPARPRRSSSRCSPSSIPATRSSSSSRSTMPTCRCRPWPAASPRVVTPATRPTGRSTRTSWPPRSRTARSCSCSTRRTTRPARSSPAPNWS